MKQLHGRMLRIFCSFMALFSLLFLRTGSLSSGETLAETANRQSSFTLTVEKTRGTIYDSRMRPLTGTKEKYIAAVVPSEENEALILSDRRFLAEHATLLEKLSEGYPFLTEVSGDIADIPQVTVFHSFERYAEDALASHIIGYTNGDGTGVAGMEQAYDSLLSGVSAKTTVSYTVDALRRPLAGAEPEIRLAPEPVEGVVLTIDKRLQEICEEVGSKYLKKGAVVLMEASTGKLRACASFPDYDPTNIGAAIADAENAPLVNRAFSAYNVGSVFKAVTASAALNEGISPPDDYFCTGKVTVGDTDFHCFTRTGQGKLDLNTAMTKSCNPYFITLGLSCDPERFYATAADFSFGTPTVFAPGMTSAAGTLPAEKELSLRGACANFSFGQGSLTATPVQIAQMLSGIVNGGCVMQASLVEGTTKDGSFVSEPTEGAAPVRAVTAETANRVKEALVRSVMDNQEHKARPRYVSAGGKTGTAQTGRFHEDGTEILQGWFAGFFPAEEPQYILVVLAEDAEHGSSDAAPIFQEIVNRMTSRPPQPD